MDFENSQNDSWNLLWFELNELMLLLKESYLKKCVCLVIKESVTNDQHKFSISFNLKWKEIKLPVFLKQHPTEKLISRHWKTPSALPSLLSALMLKLLNLKVHYNFNSNAWKQQNNFQNWIFQLFRQRKCNGYSQPCLAMQWIPWKLLCNQRT